MKPFIRTKLIKGNEYLYEVTPYYDEETGKWRQKTRYLGKNRDGEPVRREKKSVTGQILNFGEYIPAYWAVREYKILESLFLSCSPDEAASVVLLAINRILDPCPPSNLTTWLKGTYLSHLIPDADLHHDNLSRVLQKISERPVVGAFSHMFASIHDLSGEQILYALQRLPDSPFLCNSETGLYPFVSGQDQGIWIPYYPGKKVLADIDTFSLPLTGLSDSLGRVCFNENFEGIIVPFWDEFSPALLSCLLNARCHFIAGIDPAYPPVASLISSLGDEVHDDHDFRYGKNEAWCVSEITIKINHVPVSGFIVRNQKEQQAKKLALTRTIHRIRDYIQSNQDYLGTDSLSLREIAGPYSRFFHLDEKRGGKQVRIDNSEVDRVVRQFGHHCLLYTGDRTWEECVTLTQMRATLEQEINQYLSQFERDFISFRIDRIQYGMIFICYLAVLIKNLITNRLLYAQIPEISSFDSLITELSPIHVLKSYQPSISPEHLTRRQKTAISFFGGIPPMK